MMSINRRVKELRKYLQLNQNDFGANIGMGQAGVSKIEQDGNTVTEQTIKSVCQTYNVSERWLRDGIGDMLLHNQPVDALRDVSKHYHLKKTEEKILRVYLELDEIHRQAITDFIIQSADEMNTVESSIDEKVEAYRRQLIAQARE